MRREKEAIRKEVREAYRKLCDYKSIHPNNVLAIKKLEAVWYTLDKIWYELYGDEKY